MKSEILRNSRKTSAPLRLPSLASSPGRASRGPATARRLSPRSPARSSPRSSRSTAPAASSGLEHYQSGILISGKGHVLTVSSYVLDSDEVTVVLDDGRHFTAQQVAADPLTEIAVLKFDPGEATTCHISTRPPPPPPNPGTRVLAFSNLFGIAAGEEPVSMSARRCFRFRPAGSSTRRRSRQFSRQRLRRRRVGQQPRRRRRRRSPIRRAGCSACSAKSSVAASPTPGSTMPFPSPPSHPTVEDILAGRFTRVELKEVDRPRIHCRSQHSASCWCPMSSRALHRTSTASSPILPPLRLGCGLTISSS